MRRVLSRLVPLARFVLTFRGLMILAATALAVVAATVEDAFWIAGGLSLLLWALVVLLASLRQAEMNRWLRQVSKEVSRLDRIPPAGVPVRGATSAPYGPKGRGDLAVETAKARLRAVRQQLAIDDSDGRDRPMAGVVDVGATRSIVPGSGGPLVTFVVAVQDQEDIIADCLLSIRRQLFEDWDCIVIDDGSTDESPRIVAAVTEGDDRFTLVRHGVRSGRGASLNTGIRLARGSLIAPVEPFDLLRPDSLLDRVDTFLAHSDETEVAGVFCGVEVDGVGRNTLDLSEEWLPALGFVDFINSGSAPPFPITASLTRRDVLVGVGGVDESLPKGIDDWDLWQRVLRAGFIFLPSALESVVRTALHSEGVRDPARFARLLRDKADRAYVSSKQNTAGIHGPGFPEGLSYYQKGLSIGEQTIRFAVAQLMSGDRPGAHAGLEMIEEESWPWLDRHLDVRSLAEREVLSLLGLKPEQTHHVEREASPIVEEIVEAVRRHTHKSDLPAPPDSTGDAAVDFLLVPQNRAQLVAMLATAEDPQSEISTDNAGVLLLDRLAGDQGVRLEASASGLPMWSLNEWSLQRSPANTLVVGAIRDTAVEGIIDAAVNAGVNLLEIREPGAEIMQVLQTREPRGDISSRWLEQEPSRTIDWAASVFGSGALENPIAPESVWSIEERPHLKVDAREIEHFRDRHQGDRVFIIGNGPSLNRTDLRKLDGSISIGVNAIFLATDDLGFTPTYYVVEDTAVVRDNLDRIRRYQTEHRFFPSIYRELIGNAPRTSFFNMNQGFYEKRSPAYSVPRFSTNAALRLFAGQSVTIMNLQLAYFMGFTEVVLIGMDFDYSVPEDSVIDGNHILSMGDDPNHFHPDYFGKGKVWKDPKLDRVLANYQLAKLMFEADGRRIVNATPGGKLELFDRVPFETLVPL